MNIYPIKISDTDLASRQAAAELRAQIEKRASQGEKISVDFSSVLSISESYADELFGVLAFRYGLEWLSENVVLHRLNSFAFRAIASAIRQRLASQSPTAPDSALLAARKALKHRQSSAA